MLKDNRTKNNPHFLPAAALCGLLLLTGCATPPAAGVRTFYIAGSAYVPLDAICSQKGIKPDYDPLTRTVSLSRDSSDLRFQVGRKDALLNGRLTRLLCAPDLLKGMVVIPRELRQKIEELFPGQFPPQAFRALKKVIIDPGHGGKDPGAIGRRGVIEKEVVLDISRRLRDSLQQEGLEVLMTRSTDVFIPLEQRAEMANRSKADLFISIHANANPSRGLKGFEVYYISPVVSDSRRALLSARRDELKLEDCLPASPSVELKAILWDLTYAFDRREAIELAKTICKAAGSDPDTRVLGVKNANFSVLRGVIMPAVLIEVGFLSNSSEEALIASAAYRRRIAENIKNGLRDYCGQKQQSLVKEGR